MGLYKKRRGHFSCIVLRNDSRRPCEQTFERFSLLSLSLSLFFLFYDLLIYKRDPFSHLRNQETYTPDSRI